MLTPHSLFISIDIYYAIGKEGEQGLNFSIVVEFPPRKRSFIEEKPIEDKLLIGATKPDKRGWVGYLDV